MPKIEAGAFKRHVEAGALYPLYFLYGDEKYLLRRGASRLVKKAGDQPFPEFNLNEFSSRSTVDSIADAALALPFMAEHKCVLVSDFDVEAQNAAELSKLTELLENLSESTVLVFSAPTLLIDLKKSAKWRGFLKSVESVGASVAFGQLENGDLVRLLCAEVEKRGSRITKYHAGKVLEYAGKDLSHLLNELDKLCAYAKDREISAEDIELLVTKSLETTVFVLSKAIVSGDYPRAYQLLDALFYGGEKAVPILAVLSSTFVDMYRVRAALQAGKSAQAPAEYGDYKGREFRLRNAERDLRGLSTEALRSCMDLLLDTDLLLKGSRLDEKIVMETMIAKLLVVTKRGADR